MGSGSPFGGVDPVHNAISANVAYGNGVGDIKYDMWGSNNTFPGNLGGRSRPKGICD